MPHYLLHQEATLFFTEYTCLSCSSQSVPTLPSAITDNFHSTYMFSKVMFEMKRQRSMRKFLTPVPHRGIINFFVKTYVDRRSKTNPNKTWSRSRSTPFALLDFQTFKKKIKKYKLHFEGAFGLSPTLGPLSQQSLTWFNACLHVCLIINFTWNSPTLIRNQIWFFWTLKECI